MTAPALAKKSLPFWLVALLLSPLLMWQGYRTRRTARRLLEAAGPQSGAIGDGPNCRVLIIGESPVAGVGVSSQADGIGPAIARPLAQRTGRTVHWRCHGVNGIRLSQLLAHPLHDFAADADIIILMMGVNDTTSLTHRTAWSQDLARAFGVLSAQGAQVCATRVPPMGHFLALPQPLRFVAGWRARLLDQTLRERCLEEGKALLDYGEITAASLLAEDGYHPSAEGFRLMGQHLADQLATLRPAEDIRGNSWPGSNS